MISKKELGLIISLSGFSITINTLPSLVTWFSQLFDIPFSLFSFVFAFQYASFAFFSIMIGKFSSLKKVNLPLVLVIALSISAISIGFIGFSWSFAILILFMIVIGGAGGSVESIGTALLAHESQNKNFIYFSQFFYAVGAFIAPLIISILLSLDTSIPLITLIIGFFSIFIVLVVAPLIFNKKRTRLHVDVPIQKPLDEEIKEHSQSTTLFIAIFLAMIMYVILESSIASWLPSYFESSLNYKPPKAASMLTSFWAGLMIARLWYSFYKKKGLFKYLMIHVIIMVVFIIVIVCLKNHSSYILILGSCFIVGLGCGPIWPLLVEYCMHMFDKPHYTMYLIAGGSIGALIGPLLTALIFSYIGIESFFFIMTCYTLILMICIIRTHPRKRLVH